MNHTDPLRTARAALNIIANGIDNPKEFAEVTLSALTAQSAAAKDEQELAEIVGDTRFEGWLSESITRTGHYIKQDMREAYWAGYQEARAALAQQAKQAKEQVLAAKVVDADMFGNPIIRATYSNLEIGTELFAAPPQAEAQQDHLHGVTKMIDTQEPVANFTVRDGCVIKHLFYAHTLPDGEYRLVPVDEARQSKEGNGS